jgi:hypothetical protein
MSIESTVRENMSIELDYVDNKYKRPVYAGLPILILQGVDLVSTLSTN